MPAMHLCMEFDEFVCPAPALTLCHNRVRSDVIRWRRDGNGDMLR